MNAEKISFSFEGPIYVMAAIAKAFVTEVDDEQVSADGYEVFNFSEISPGKLLDEGRKVRPLVRQYLENLVLSGGILKDLEAMDQFHITKDQLTAFKSGITRRCGSVRPGSYLLDTAVIEGVAHTYLGSQDDDRAIGKYTINKQNLEILTEYFG